MSDVIIQAENLGKRYQLGRASGSGASYHTLRDTLSEGARSLFRRNGTRREAEEFWALRDLSFEVKQGEVVGIIGRNGAGKSTLLKILSRITEPTTGKVRIKGRVASLLEVGTGFHPELTGRENIFLNGAILGMTRVEIKAKFDEIVGFAEVAEFLDTPVKRYSSGMYVRLAFAVAAHLEPEILVVDEVLAVGDAEFQKKCLGKMENVAREGRTILFVSHNMGAINRLCSRCLLLRAGRVEMDDTPQRATAVYLESGGGFVSQRAWSDTKEAPASDSARLRAARVCDADDRVANWSISADQHIGVQMEFQVLQRRVLIPNFHFYNTEGYCLFLTHDWESEWRSRERMPGLHVSTVWIPPHFLNEGTVVVGVALTTYKPFELHYFEREAISFQLHDEGNSPTRGDYAFAIPGAVRPRLRWTNALRQPAEACIAPVSVMDRLS